MCRYPRIEHPWVVVKEPYNEHSTHWQLQFKPGYFEVQRLQEFIESQ